MNAYQLRSQNIRLLGFGCYADYLASLLWKSIRYRVMQRDGWRCRKCKRKAWQVHHDDYEMNTMLGHSLDGLRAVCGPCHEDIESGPKGLFGSHANRETMKAIHQHQRFADLHAMMKQARGGQSA